MANNNKLKKQKKLARRRVLTINHKSKRLGLTPAGYLYFRLKSNLHKFTNHSVFNFLVAVLIIFSIFLIFCEYTYPPGPMHDRVVAANDTITWMFVIELLLRFIGAPSKRVFFSNFWIDILAVLPVFRIFRTLRILRLMRVLRAVRATMILLKQSGWLSSRLERYFGSFGVLFVVTSMLIICGTLALLSVDPSLHEGQSVLQIFMDKVWLTTFLFISGEFTAGIPPTPAGKGIAAMISVAGLVVFAIMVGTISASMTAFFRTKMDQKDIKISELKGHLIICGWDRMGGAILHEIEAVSEFWSRGVVVVAETDEDIFASLKIRSTSRCFHVKQDYTKIDVLESVGVKRAASAIVLADKGNALRDQDRDARTVLAALTLEKLNPEIFTIAELLDDQNAGHLHIAGVEEIISRTDITAGLFATDVISHGIGSVVKELLTHRRGNYLKKLPLPDDQTGKSFIEVLTYFKQEYDATIIGVDRKDEKGIFKAKVNPPSDFLLQEDDQLVVVVQRESAMCELDE